MAATVGGLVRADPRQEGAIRAIQDRLTLFLKAFRTIAFCERCLALKLDAFPREVEDALIGLGARYGFETVPGQCSECLRETKVIRALAA